MSKKYPQILALDAPSLIKFSAPLLGVRETPGRADNATILDWADEVERALNVKHLGYTADSIPWCGLFVGVVAVRAGWSGQMPKTPLWARSWLEFGEEALVPMFGDILVFGRDGGGHVAICVGEDASAYHVLGGNQSDAVTITRIAKTRLLGARRPKWRVAQPASVRIIRMGVTGPLSKNEA
jgi:uncharacterized protein (TIGR02594 family)